MPSNGAPTFTEIRDRILADIDSELQATGETHGPIEYMWAVALAGVCLMLHWAIRLIGRDRVPSTARPEYMRQWAAFFGIFPKSATKNHGTAVFEAHNPGASIPAGKTLRTPAGVEFTVDADASAELDESENAYFIVVDITAVEEGAAGAAAPGDMIFLGSPIPNVDSEGTVGPEGIGGGEDDESNPEILGRLLERLRDPPGGGTDADYRRWTRSTEGVPVLSVWIRPNTLGPSSVKVLFTVNRVPSHIPNPTDEEAVTEYLQQFKPADVLRAEAYAPEVDLFSPTIRLDPDNLETQAEASDAIERYLRGLDAGGTLVLSHLSAMLDASPAIEDHKIESPPSNVAATSSDHVFVLDEGNTTYLPMP